LLRPIERPSREANGTGEAENCVQRRCQLGDGVCLRGVGETTGKVEIDTRDGESWRGGAVMGSQKAGTASVAEASRA